MVKHSEATTFDSIGRIIRNLQGKELVHFKAMLEG